MTTLIKTDNGFQLPETLRQGQDYMGGKVLYDSATGKPLLPGQTTLSRPAGSAFVPPSSPTGNLNSPTDTNTGGNNSSISTLLMQILKDAQNQYTGNNTALLKGKENIQATNSGVYSQDLKNANLTNEARLSLLNNDSGIQDPGLNSITDQQKMNETHYNTTNDNIKNALDAYNKEQDRIQQATSDLADAKYKADTLAETIRAHKADEAAKKNGGGNMTFDTQSNISATTSKMQSIEGSDHYVDPYVWIQMRNLWGQHGGSDSSFVSNFKRFVNPASYDLVGFKSADNGA